MLKKRLLISMTSFCAVGTGLLLLCASAQAQQRALKTDDLVDLLHSRTSTAQIIALAKVRCSDVSVIAGESRIREAGAGDSLLIGLLQQCWIGVTGEVFYPAQLVAMLKSDLRNLVVAEEIFFTDSSTYTKQLEKLQFAPSRGVVVTIVGATATGWAAMAYAKVYPASRCGIFVGNATPPLSARTENVPTCSYVRQTTSNNTLAPRP